MPRPNSKRIAGLVGPSIVAMVASEFPLVQPHLYDAQIPPVVYLSGVLMFIGGLAIVRAHNHWVPDWSVLVTLSGWFFLALGRGVVLQGCGREPPKKEMDGRRPPRLRWRAPFAAHLQCSADYGDPRGE